MIIFLPQRAQRSGAATKIENHRFHRLHRLIITKNNYVNLSLKNRLLHKNFAKKNTMLQVCSTGADHYERKEEIFE